MSVEIKEIIKNVYQVSINTVNPDMLPLVIRAEEAAAEAEAAKEYVESKADEIDTAYNHSQVLGNPHLTPFAQLVDIPTLLADFGITDAYTQQQVDAIVSSAIVQSTAAYVSLNPDGSLPSPITDNNFTIIGEGDYGGGVVVADGNLGILSWDGSSWSKVDEVELPKTEVEDEYGDSIQNAASQNLVTKLKNDIIFESVQIIDKETMLASGQIRIDNGAVLGGNNYIRTDWVSCKEDTNYCLKGLGYLGTPGARVTFYNYAGGQKISHIAGLGNNADIVFKTPLGCTALRINVIFEIDVAADIPNSSIYDTVFLYEGDDLSIEYQNYKAKSLNKNLLPFSLISHNMYYSSLANQQVNVFLQEGETQYYYGFHIVYEKNDNPIVNVDYWRINGAKRYKLVEGNMIDTGVNIISTSESEFAFKQVGKADFTGGYHGDELLTGVLFFADNKEINHTSDNPLTPVSSFRYEVKSTMHEAPNSSSPTTPIPSNPTIARHNKITTFCKSGVNIRNVVRLSVGMDIENFYIGLVSVGSYLSRFGRNELGDSHEFILETNINRLPSNICDTFITNSLNGGAVIRSYINKSGVGTSIGQNSNELKMFVVDRLGDSKYYRGMSNFSNAAHEWYDFTCEIIFN